MHTELFFLRSFEQNIVNDLLDEFEHSNTTKERLQHYTQHFGLTKNDVGIYLMVDNRVAAGAWVRNFKASQNTAAYVDETIPELIFAIKKPYRNKALLRLIFPQLLEELRRNYDAVSIALPKEHFLEKLLTSYGFSLYEREPRFCTLLQQETLTFIKPLERIVETFNGYPLVTKDAWY